MPTLLAAAASFLLLMACAQGVSPGATGGSRNLITAEEIAAASTTTALDLVQQLRPNWLRGRGPVSIGRDAADVPVVYVDDVRNGDPSVLERISSQIVTEIRFLSASDATTMFGLGHGGGAIMVRTRRR
jgi:hypothetical protein